MGKLLSLNFFKISASESHVGEGSWKPLNVNMGGEGGLKPLNGIEHYEMLSLEW